MECQFGLTNDPYRGIMQESIDVETRFLTFRQSIRDKSAAWLIRADDDVTPLFDSAGDMSTAYSRYPFLLYRAFPKVPLNAVRDIALAGRSYFAFLKTEDSQLDSGSQSPLCSYYEEQYVGKFYNLLSNYFAPDSTFWNHFWQLQDNYRQALLTETIADGAKVSTISWVQYKDLAAAKSCVAKAAYYALESLDEGAVDDSIRYDFEVSHDHLSVGLQIVDDVRDWRRDASVGRITLFIRDVLDELGLDTAGLENSRKFLSELSRRVYKSEALRKWIALSREQFRESARVCDSEELGDWRRFLLHTGSTIERETDKLRIEVSYASGSQKDSRIKHSRDDIESRVQLALEFLYRQQKEDGSWEDFRTRARDSNVWVTGFVLANLNSVKGKSDEIDAAAEFLRQRWTPGGGWGYNSQICDDADSTSFAVRGLVESGQDCDTEMIQQALNFLLSHIQADGGIATYARDAEIRRAMKVPDELDFTGWTSAHACVSAPALKALFNAGLIERQKIRHWVRSNQQEGGNFVSYWWDGDAYATSHACELMDAIGLKPDSEPISRAKGWLKAAQQLDGSWSGRWFRLGSAFQTSMSIRGLLAGGLGVEDVEASAKGVDWLLRSQRTDGSWPFSPILRIPHPDVLGTHSTQSLRLRSESGLGIVVSDTRRVFTTAACLGTLALYTAIGSAPGNGIRV